MSKVLITVGGLLVGFGIGCMILKEPISKTTPLPNNTIYFVDTNETTIFRLELYPKSNFTLNITNFTGTMLIK